MTQLLRCDCQKQGWFKRYRWNPECPAHGGFDTPQKVIDKMRRELVERPPAPGEGETRLVYDGKWKRIPAPSPDNAKLVERLEALAQDFQSDPTTGEAYDKDGRTIIEAIIALEALRTRIAELEKEVELHLTGVEMGTPHIGGTWSVKRARKAEAYELEYRARIAELEKERDELFLNNGWAANHIAELERDRDIWRKKAGG